MHANQVLVRADRAFSGLILKRPPIGRPFGRPSDSQRLLGRAIYNAVRTDFAMRHPESSTTSRLTRHQYPLPSNGARALTVECNWRHPFETTIRPPSLYDRQIAAAGSTGQTPVQRLLGTRYLV